MLLYEYDLLNWLDCISVREVLITFINYETFIVMEKKILSYIFKYNLTSNEITKQQHNL